MTTLLLWFIILSGEPLPRAYDTQAQCQAQIVRDGLKGATCRSRSYTVVPFNGFPLAI